MNNHAKCSRCDGAGGWERETSSTSSTWITCDDCKPPKAQQLEGAGWKIAGYAQLINYPDAWDLTKFPTLELAVKYTLAASGKGPWKVGS